MQIQTTSEQLLRSRADWNRIAQEAVKPQVDEIELTSEPAEAQATIKEVHAFLQRNIGDIEHQKLQNQNSIGTFRIDANAKLQLTKEAESLDIDLNSLFANLKERQVQAPEAYTGRKVFEGALLGAAVSAAIHAIRSASGATGNLPFSALTTFACLVAGVVIWPNARSIELGIDPSGKLTGKVNVASQ